MGSWVVTGRGARPTGRRTVLVLASLLGPALAACRVPQPEPRQVRDMGFATPRKAFESMVTAFQGELLDAEYETFSTAFVRRNRLSQHVYRDFRPELLARVPGLRWGLYRSRVEEITHLDPRHALLVARVPVPLADDVLIHVRLVREDFYEVWAGDEILADGYGPPGELDLEAQGHLSVQRTDGARYLWARADLEDDLPPPGLAGVRDVRFAREWRIDDIWAE